ncbi:hypothetical protein BS50DRAFT_581924 [Corynespora cassiicola Philippines]|uniref:Uncharacterized protein n=1 Tax=Corynespora cassiicola Philippines TaxID=1448308 RepID=A0A2T2PC15_CORCC|nr:hypothetical protein BS50DRAFT_581924 [Corynespora cassiicola Philippines]
MRKRDSQLMFEFPDDPEYLFHDDDKEGEYTSDPYEEIQRDPANEIETVHGQANVNAFDRAPVANEEVVVKNRLSGPFPTLEKRKSGVIAGGHQATRIQPALKKRKLGHIPHPSPFTIKRAINPLKVIALADHLTAASENLVKASVTLQKMSLTLNASKADVWPGNLDEEGLGAFAMFYARESERIEKVAAEEEDGVA